MANHLYHKIQIENSSIPCHSSVSFLLRHLAERNLDLSCIFQREALSGFSNFVFSPVPSKQSIIQSKNAFSVPETKENSVVSVKLNNKLKRGKVSDYVLVKRVFRMITKLMFLGSKKKQKKGSVNQQKLSFYKQFEYELRHKDIDIKVDIHHVASPMLSFFKEKSLFKGNLTKDYFSIIFANLRFREAFKECLERVKDEEENDKELQKGIFLIELEIERVERLGEEELVQIVKRARNLSKF